jgi:hypothetical protein
VVELIRLLQFDEALARLSAGPAFCGTPPAGRKHRRRASAVASFHRDRSVSAGRRAIMLGLDIADTQGCDLLAATVY